MPIKRRVAVVFIHGLAKKPAPDKLLEVWLWGLGRGDPMPTAFPAPNRGLDLVSQGVPHGLGYYADVFYGEQYEIDLSAYYELNEALEIAAERLDRVEGDLKPPQPATADEARFIEGFEAKLRAQPVLVAAEAATPQPPAEAPESAPIGQQKGFEIARWLPGPVKQAIIKKAAMEAFYYLFDKEYERADGQRFQVRHELRTRLLKELATAQAAADKTVVVSHSMGTMVAYDVLRNCPECPPVDTLFTLGSPLGIREVQDELAAEGAGGVDFPAARLARWVNVYDPLDPVCGADPRFANDYRPVDGKRVEDIQESNWGRWRHTITHYLAGERLRAELAGALGLERA